MRSSATKIFGTIIVGKLRTSIVTMACRGSAIITPRSNNGKQKRSAETFFILILTIRYDLADQWNKNVYAIDFTKRRWHNRESKLWSNYCAWRRRTSSSLASPRQISFLLLSFVVRKKNPPDLHLETIRFLPFPAGFSRERRRWKRRWMTSGRRMKEGKTARAKANEWASGSRRENWKEKDRQGGTWPERASQSAHSASFSPFPSAICSPASFSASASSTKGLHVVSVDSQ